MMRKSFSLLYALIFIILISLAITAIITIQKKSIIQTRDIYLDIASDNALKNLTELSILAIQAHDFKNGCIKQINYEFLYLKELLLFIIF